MAAQRSKLVNLDAMIKRADFATEEAEDTTYDSVSTISVRDFTKGALIGPNLRKPDFQRETNHWTPEQVVSLLECFVNGDLIPSVILWQSPSYLFVIDGGHRLSVLKAWVEDDYGDGPISQELFGFEVSKEQREVADKTRNLVAKTIGSWQHLQAKIYSDNLSQEERKRVNTIASRGMPIQWVKGDADKAESSFFTINTQGTALDDVEELLLKSRKKPISISARAVIRAGKGHRYWSSFEPVIAKEIEQKAKELHEVLFEPELKRPVKTLDLPLGGSKGVRTALQVLIDFMLNANRNQLGQPKKIYDQPDDIDGNNTYLSLKNSIKLAKRITGNDTGSLGLHPAVYFYGPSGRHSGPMFMGTVALIGRVLANNDSHFFKNFTNIREPLEQSLIEHKDLIATILQKHSSNKRTDRYRDILSKLINYLSEENTPTEDWLIQISNLQGKLLSGGITTQAQNFSHDVKSETFIVKALSSAQKCPICNGYLDAEKSVSYDHIKRVREGGKGDVGNCQLVHPYCNQSIKC